MQQLANGSRFLNYTIPLHDRNILSITFNNRSVGQLVGWLVGRLLVGWLVGRSVGWSVGWLVGRWVSWLVSSQLSVNWLLVSQSAMLAGALTSLGITGNMERI